MAKRYVQGCMAGCVTDCYSFGCQEKGNCEQFKELQNESNEVVKNEETKDLK